MSRLAFVQSARWSKQIDGGNGGLVYVYSTGHCAYCARPVRPDAVRLRTARTNDGEWWLVSADEDLRAHEWRDFQTQLDGSRGPTLLPIGPDCFRDRPEFAFAAVKVASVDDIDSTRHAATDVKRETRAIASRSRGRGEKTP